MQAAKPVLEGFFTTGENPALLGSRCVKCGTFYFPSVEGFCRNPDCDCSQFESVELSRTGKLWSFTNACYKPPEPYIAQEPFEPYAIAAVELEKEKMIVLGQVVEGVGVEAGEQFAQGGLIRCAGCGEPEGGEFIGCGAGRPLADCGEGSTAREGSCDRQRQYCGQRVAHPAAVTRTFDGGEHVEQSLLARRDRLGRRYRRRWHAGVASALDGWFGDLHPNP